ncbi:hypothetical protein [Symbioplanes lichenis]|uniref:hypothetical protein n=1 Tax=Symbioplanes lichenis TaxID=1629072 RepID=UPI002739CCA2|nr:hypothetical protein [Actinoplanes lichenis]
MPDDTDIGQAYLDLVADQLTHERAVRTSLEQRAMSVVTTSGALVTLLLAFANLRARGQGYVTPGAVVILLLTAVILLVTAVLAALSVNRPVAQDQIGDAELLGLTRRDWALAAYTDVLREVTLARCDLLSSARKANARRSRALRAAVRSEALAVLMTAAAVFVVLTSGG